MPQGILRGRGSSWSKRRTCSGSLLSSWLRKKYRVRPVQQAHLRRRGAWLAGGSAQLEGRACDQAKGWGEGLRAGGRPRRSFLTLRKLRVADLLSFELVPLLTDAPG
jgi:hypothetical protein